MIKNKQIQPKRGKFSLPDHSVLVAISLPTRLQGACFRFLKYMQGFGKRLRKFSWLWTLCPDSWACFRDTKMTLTTLLQKKFPFDRAGGQVFDDLNPEKVFHAKARSKSEYQGENVQNPPDWRYLMARLWPWVQILKRMLSSERLA